MGTIRIGPPSMPFGGIVPRTSERLLADNAAQIAVNCRLSSGELEPINAGVKRYTSAKAGPLLAIERIVDGADYAWLAWPRDVDVVKAPLYGTGRWCFSGDGEPRITTLADAAAGGGHDYPHTAYTLGTPKPVTAPTVTPSGGAGATVDRYYAYTFYAIWDGLELEGAVSPLPGIVSGKVDASWAITGMDATPPNSGTATGVYSAGVTTFTGTVPHWLRSGEEVVIGGNTLMVSATSGPTFTVPGDHSAATAWARKAAFPGTLKKRLYRSAGTTGQFQLVAEGITGSSYTDTLTDSQIPGDELISTTWEMPPAGLRGLFILPSGALGGFVVNKLCLSEPFQPHAWPPEYQIIADHEIVGAECFGSGVALATQSMPFVIQGVTPGQMSGESWKEVLPCSAKRSVCSLGDLVLYASPMGLIGINGAGASVWSLPYFTDKEFAAVAPETMVSALVKRQLYVRYKVGNVTKVLIFNLMGDSSELTEAHIDADEIHADATDGRLYYSFGSDIYEFDADDGYAMAQDWMSKEIVLPAPANLGAAKVDFVRAIDPAQAAAIEAEIAAVTASNAALMASGNVRGAWNSMGWNTTRWGGSGLAPVPTQPPANEVSFQFYAGGELKCVRTVRDAKVFRLTSGFKADRVAVRVSSQCKIKSIELGQTPRSIAEA